MRGLEGDNAFASAHIWTFCEDNHIRSDTSVAKQEHVSNCNRLGILDRLVRTLRGRREKYYLAGIRTDVMETTK